MKKTLLATAILLTASGTHAAWTSPDGALTIGGDAEINLDAKSVDVSDDFNSITDEASSIGDDSRIKLQVDWQTTTDNGQYINARIQPLMKTNGNFAMDDSYVTFGQQDAWEFQVGRYEAMELFSKGKDTVLTIAGGADSFGAGVYYYYGHEARGRSGDMGQARISTEAGNFKLELSSLFGDAAEVYGGQEDYLNEYHGLLEEEYFEVQSSDNTFMVRPAVQYTSDSGFFDIRVGAEYEVSGSATNVSYSDSNGVVNGQLIDLSELYGYAVRTEFNLSDDLSVRLSGAYQDVQDLWQVTTYGLNMEYKAFGLGYVASENELEDASLVDVSSYVLYAAYTMPLMDFDNAEVTFAVSHSETENLFGQEGRDEEATQARVRINYFFE